MSLQCYRCGASLAALTLPLSRLDTCPECRSELHVCRMCEHFAPNRSPQCTTETAEEVRCIRFGARPQQQTLQSATQPAAAG
jgi:hypothetical protein